MNIEKSNSGIIFKNDYKQEGDNKPHYRGNINVDGKQFEIALFLNKDKSGKPYFGVAIQEPYKKAETKTTTTEQPTEKYGKNEGTVDQLPF